MPTDECRLDDIPLRERVELIRIDLPDELAEPLLEHGVVPGCSLCPLRRSPAGDPIYEIDGTVLAMRRETACCLLVKRSSGEAA
jgi:Fe2+ transport system protein FeoA